MSLSYKHVQSLFIGILIGLVCIPLVYAERALMQVDMDTGNKPRLQNGAKVFMNYCSGCHALGYLRYNRMAQDLGLTTGNGQVDQDLLINNLVFTQAPIYAPIEIAMPTVSARQWFGAVPPDLSLIARQHSAEWLYTYLLSFYEDRTRPFGSNNALVPNVAMPNVFAPLTGRVLAMHEKKIGDLSAPKLYFMGNGAMQALEFETMVRDVVTFLVYVAEPGRLYRYRIGTFVILYLCVFLGSMIWLKKNYWKDIPPS